jgi:hypothetical protein
MVVVRQIAAVSASVVVTVAVSIVFVLLSVVVFAVAKDTIDAPATVDDSEYLGDALAAATMATAAAAAVAAVIAVVAIGVFVELEECELTVDAKMVATETAFDLYVAVAAVDAASYWLKRKRKRRLRRLCLCLCRLHPRDVACGRGLRTASSLEGQCLALPIVPAVGCDGTALRDSHTQPQGLRPC